MAITVACKCGKRFGVKDELAGKRIKCPGCGDALGVPVSRKPAEAGPKTAVKTVSPKKPPPDAPSVPAKQPTRKPSKPKSADDTAPVTAKDETVAAQSIVESLKPKLKNEAPPDDGEAEESGMADTFRDYFYLALVLAFIPIVVSLLRKEDDDLRERFLDAIAQAPPEAQLAIKKRLFGEIKLIKLLSEAPVYRVKLEEQKEPTAEDMSIEELLPEEVTPDYYDMVLPHLPEKRLPGALLPRDSWLHWAIAGVSTAVFLSLAVPIFAKGAPKPWQLFLVGFFTATVGIFFLIIVQIAAFFTSTRFLIGARHPFVFVIVLILQFLAFSYSCAVDPRNGFWLSFFGFTFGVGLCEEFCKGFPVLWRFRQRTPWSWKRACLWGLASGIGFGVAEGIFYSSNFYNGITGPDVYILRFVSCVALHAVWSASVGLSLYAQKERVKGEVDWGEFIFWMLIILSVPMVLHGLYDTFLKKDMPILALVVAVGSFAWLVWQVETTRIAKIKERERKAKRRVFEGDKKPKLRLPY